MGAGGLRLLPARLAWLACAVSIVLVGEPAALLGVSTTSAAIPSTVAAPVAPAISTAITSTVKPATAAGSRAARCCLRARFVHFQISSAAIFPIQPCNGLRCFRIIGHLDKRKSSRPACLTIHSDVDPRNLSERLEH